MASLNPISLIYMERAPLPFEKRAKRCKLSLSHVSAKTREGFKTLQKRRCPCFFLEDISSCLPFRIVAKVRAFPFAFGQEKPLVF